jgi:hypothetical protein
MFQRIFHLVLLLVLASATNGQGVVTLRDAQGQVVNGSLISQSALQSTDTVKLLAELTGPSFTEVNIRRYELWTVPDTRNFFCWGVCYLPVDAGVRPAWVSQHWLEMEPATVYPNFAAYHEANGQSGSVARFRYVWFDRSDPLGSDSSWVDIDFGGTVGLTERPPVVRDLVAFPNPSHGQDVWLEYAMEPWVVDAELIIYTVLGERVTTLPMKAAENRALLRSAGMTAGIYFATVERNGRALATRRFVITP